MCDTIVAPGSVTADGVTLFGKNSDREPNEAHHLLRIPRAKHAKGSTVKCTYIEIPQVAETYEVLLAKPFWIWGAEMGANEYGVAIGNEAIFTKVPYEKEPSLIGMDLLRLALERAKTARAALDVITGLLAEYGQGGNCGMDAPSYYHNGFIIADPSDAWVLQTAGRQWAAEQVKGICTISNAITIGDRWDLASDDLVSYAVDKGWCKGRDDFDFARCYSDFIYTTFARGRQRQSCTANLLMGQKGRITTETVMRALRDHGPEVRPDYRPGHGFFDFTVCAHGGFGPVHEHGQTTGSMVSYLAPDVQTHYLTGTAAPCTGIFKPVWLGADLPGTGPQPTATYDGMTLFWQHEALHRATLRDYPRLIRLYQGERDELEQRFMEGVQAVCRASADKRAAYSAGCFAQADEAESEWLEKVLKAGGPARQGPLYAMAWKGINQAAGLPGSS